MLKTCSPIMLCTAMLVAACGGGSTATSASTSSAPTTAPRPARGSANVIVESEITGGGARNALEVIQLLRPAMLRARNGATSEQPGGVEIVIYLDGVRAGGREALTAVPADRVREIRLLNASDATTRFGTGHPLGAVLVSTKR